MGLGSLIVAFMVLSISINGCIAADANSALSLIQQDLAKATETLNHTADLFKKEADRGQAERFGTCIEEYRAVVSRNLPNAASGVKQGGPAGFGAAVSELQATQQHADNCENQFAGAAVSPFTAETKAVKDLAQRAIDSIQNSGLGFRRLR